MCQYAFFSFNPPKGHAECHKPCPTSHSCILQVLRRASKHVIESEFKISLSTPNLAALVLESNISYSLTSLHYNLVGWVFLHLPSKSRLSSKRYLWPYWMRLSKDVAALKWPGPWQKSIGSADTRFTFSCCSTCLQSISPIPWPQLLESIPV